MPVVILAGLLTDADKEAREALQPRECLEKPLHPQGYLRLVEALKQIMRQSPSLVDRLC